MKELPDDAEESAESIERWTVYADYNKILRTWLVAYGIGAPVLIATSPRLSDILIASKEAKVIVALFLVAVACQVCISLINKWCAWYIYAGVNDANFQKKCSYKLWACINEWYWIDITFDIVSICLFFYATVKILSLLN